MKPKVAIVKCADYSNASDAVQKAVALIGGMERIVHKGEKVLVKPNVLASHPPERAVTTHPEVVRGVLKMLNPLGVTVTLGDSPGISEYGEARRTMRVSGMEALAKEENVKLVVFESNPAKIKIGESELCVAREALEADRIISIPKLKTHTLMFYTGAMKNMFGVVVGGSKQCVHRAGPTAEKFSKLMVEIFEKFMPDLSVMDAVVGKELEGATGKLHKVGLILAGTDAVALDAVAATIIGLKPERVPIIKVASERGLGTANLDGIEIVGERIEDVKCDFGKPKTYVSHIASLFWQTIGPNVRSKPVVNASLCEGCEECAEHCPANAIVIAGVPSFDYKKCIRCYCCRELCPEGAIDVGVHWILRPVIGSKKE
jgi:uncharacterized protein (DUF362 family)/Pyruvate/2-oxoacid:ferredoxin oxidoreductase delta subunit